MKEKHRKRLESALIWLEDIRVVIAEAIGQEPKDERAIEGGREEPVKTEEDPDATKTIVMLKEGDEHVKIRAKIEKIGGIIHGDKWKLRSVVLRDSTQSIDLVLWNEEIPRADNLSVGDEVLVEAWQVVKYKDKLQLKLGKYGKITRTDGQQQIEL